MLKPNGMDGQVLWFDPILGLLKQAFYFPLHLAYNLKPQFPINVRQNALLALNGKQPWFLLVDIFLPAALFCWGHHSK